MTCIIERTPTGYSAHLVEMPDCVETAQSLDVAVHLLREQLSSRFHSDPESIPLTFKAQTPSVSIEASIPVSLMANTLLDATTARICHDYGIESGDDGGNSGCRPGKDD